MTHLRQRIRDMNIKTLFSLLVLVALITVVTIQLLYVNACLKYATKQSKSYFDSLSGQITGEINSSLEEVQRTASRIAYSENIQKYLTTQDSYRRVALSNAARDVIRFGIAGNRAIQSIRVYQSPSSYLGYNINDTSLVVGDIFSRFDLNMGERFAPFFSNAFSGHYTAGSHFAYIMPVYDIHAGSRSSESIGVLFALCTADAFSGLRNDSSFPGLGLFLFDQDMLISHNDVEPPEALFSEVTRNTAVPRQSRIQTPDGPLLARITPLPDTTFILCCTLPQSVLTNGIQSMVVRSLAFSLIGILLIVGMSCVTFSSMVRPIERMTREMERIENGDNHARLTPYAANEVGRIAANINRMLDQLGSIHLEMLRNQQRLYNTELARVRAELQFLHSQINPHFLYNSLECIRSIALVNGQTDIVTMSVSLSRILRYSIQSDQMVELRKEISLAQDYFSVINIRNMNIHKLRVSMDESLGGTMVIKMLLQPLIENCFHAFRDDGQSGEVSIFADRCPEGLRICVQDNGCGMSRETCHLLNERLKACEPAEGESIGLANIQKRIRLTYGESFGLSVDSLEGRGTSVTILLPLAAERSDSPAARE